MSVTIQLEQCARTFDNGTHALEPTDLTIEGGETLVFLGPSGCGKTTTLRLVAGLDMPDAGGRVRFDGEDVTDLPIERRNVGMVFQSYALFPNMSVEENIAYGLKVRKLAAPQRAARVAEMLEMMHIGELARHRIGELSGGQRQRVALARAIAPRPRVLLLDEPLTALDAKLRETLRVDIDGLLRTLGITTVYVTHDQAEAMALGDRIAVMQKGRIAQIGTPEDIYRHPANAFVADFVGTMNSLSGTVEDGHLVFSAGRLPWPHAQAGHCTVMFRPEALSLAPPGTGHFTATVVSAFFLGDHVRLLLDAGSGSLVCAKVAGERRFVKGEHLHLKLDTTATLALKD
jgi:putative spermidine/putrescine transport system ATP-binding protein